MTLRNVAIVLTLVFTAALPVVAAESSLDPPHPIEMMLFANPPEVPPGAILFVETAVINNQPVPLDFTLWGEILRDGETVLDIEPLPGQLYEWEDHLFVQPVAIPGDLELGPCLLVMHLSTGDSGEVLTRERPIEVKFPPPVRATMEVTPRIIHPWIDIYANLLVANMAPEPIELGYQAFVTHHGRPVTGTEEEYVTLDVGGHEIIPIFIDLPEGLLPGSYGVHVTTGVDSLRWRTAMDVFEVVLPSPVHMMLFVNPHRVEPGQTAYVSALLRNESEESTVFQLWGSVMHREILYQEFAPVPVALEPGEERLVALPVPVIEAAPFGRYKVRMSIGPEVGREWMAAEAFFSVKEAPGGPQQTE